VPSERANLFTRRDVLITALLLIATILAYLPALQAGFIWDDDQYVTENRALAAGLDGLAHLWIPPALQSEEAFRQGLVTPQYYPVVFTTFWIEWQLWDGAAAGYHVVNLLLHIANALLATFVARRIGIGALGAWAIGFLFALHPAHVESVAWVTERKNVLSTCFYLLAAIAYLRFDRERTSQVARDGNDTPWAWYGLAGLLFFAALLSKSVTASLPVAIVLFLLFMRERITWRRAWPLAPMLVLGAAAGLHTGYLERYHVGAIGPDWDFSLAERILIASKAFLFYPWKVVAPWPLVFIYPRWSIDAGGAIQSWPVVVSAAVGVGLLVLWIRRGVRWPLLAFLFYGVSIFPALGFANVYPHRFSFVADHFQYLASLGAIGLLAGAVAAAIRSRAARLGILALVCVVLGGLTFRQALIYDDAETLYRATVERNPDAWMAHTNLSQILLSEAQAARRAGDEGAMLAAAREAAAHARAAIEARPGHEAALTNLAEALRLQGRFDEAIPRMREAIESLKDRLAFLESRGVERLANAVRGAIAGDYALLGRLHEFNAERGLAVDSYQTALAWNDDLTIAHEAHARLAVEGGDLATAATHYQRVVERFPQHVDALLALGEHARRSGRYGEAEQWLARALQAADTSEAQMQAAFRAAWLKATADDPDVRDGAYALDVAEDLVRATQRSSPDAFDAFAAALAEMGRYDDAVRMAREALTLAEAYGLEEKAAAIRARIELYRREQPYRE